MVACVYNSEDSFRDKYDGWKKDIWDFSTTGKDTLNTLRTGDADLRFYITTVQDG